jgi:hypothetical protein
MTKKLLAWHFLPNDKKLRYGNEKGIRAKVKEGQTLKFKGEPILCQRGLHASVRLIDALQYAPGDILCRVELSGTIVHGDDKVVATERKVLWMLDAETVLHEFSCWAAEEALLKERAAGREPDFRSWDAIKIKRLFLKGKATQKELDAASVAAYSAYYSAYYAASVAAYSAAYSAATTAYSAATTAYSAHYAASVAAYSAATTADSTRDKVKEEQNTRLEKVIMTAYKKSLKGSK